MALIGELNKRVIFQMPSVTVNESGGRETTYTDVFTVWAKVRKARGDRTNEAGITGIDGTNDFIVRRSTDTLMAGNDWLINYNGKIFTIHNIEDINEHGIFIKFTAKSRADNLTGSSSS